MQPESPKNGEISKSASKNQCNPPHTQLHKKPFTNASTFLSGETTRSVISDFEYSPKRHAYLLSLSTANHRSQSRKGQQKSTFRKQQLIFFMKKQTQ